jgi:hypothetical protein
MQDLASGKYPARQVLALDETHKSRREAWRRHGYGPVGRKIVTSELFADAASFTLLVACNVHGFIKETAYVTHAGVGTEEFTGRLRDVSGVCSAGPCP